MLSLDCAFGTQDFNLLQSNSSLSLCHNRISDHNYNYTLHIYSQNKSISQFSYQNNSVELMLQCEMDYFMNITSECCGSTITIAHFNFQFTKCTNQKSHPYNKSVRLYFNCDLHGAPEYVCNQILLPTSSGKFITNKLLHNIANYIYIYILFTIFC